MEEQADGGGVDREHQYGLARPVRTIDVVADPTADIGGDPACFAHELDDPVVPLTDHDLAQLVVGLADAVVVADRHGRIALWNAAATELLGWTAAEAIGEPLEVIVPDRHRKRHAEGYAAAIGRGTTKYGGELLKVPALHRDGHELRLAFTVTLLADAGGVGGVAAVLRGATDRSR
jgi:PAS domain S-box-containing protein